MEDEGHLGRKKNQQIRVEHEKARLAIATRLCLYGIVVGTAVLFLGLITTWTTGWGATLVAPGAAVLAAGIAGMVTAKSVVTWSEQRERDAVAGQYRHREEVYGKIIENMVKSFIPGEVPEMREEANLRALASLWAAPETVEALARWREEIHPTIQRGGILGDDKEKVMSRFADLVRAMRDDLSGDPQSARHPAPEFILRSLFDDRPKLSPRREFVETTRQG